MAIFHTVQEIREKGIGNGFSVLNTADGYRQNNQVWFGECSVCGERITSSLHDKGEWRHKLNLEDGWTKQIDYCPVVKERNN